MAESICENEISLFILGFLLLFIELENVYLVLFNGLDELSIDLFSDYRNLIKNNFLNLLFYLIRPLLKFGHLFRYYFLLK